MQIWKENKTLFLFALISMLFYSSFAYDLVRTDILKLSTLYTGLFFLFYKIITLGKHHFKLLVISSILFRLVFLFAIPNLSQDFYRFIWDGRMILNGINPYLFTPESFISIGEFPMLQAKELYDGMGSLSAGHFTNYPPINQLCFVIAGLFSGENILGSVITMRFIIILADLGTLYFGSKLLKKLNIPIHNIFWYVLNPFIIIELTGNLHFESVMIFFLIWSLYLLYNNKWKLSAVILAFSISVKLIPLLFLPLFFQWFVKPANHIMEGNIHGTLKKRILRLISFYAIVILVTVALFLPFYSSEFMNNYAETVGLWFQNFEFNASFYYLFREIGYQFRGWNEIAIIGKIIPVLVIAFVLILTFFRKNRSMTDLITALLFALSFYYFASTTIHPWYISTLLILSVFTNYKFPLVWSFIVIISYFAYNNSSNTENLWIIGFEYLVVYSVLFYELFFKKRELKPLP